MADLELDVTPPAPSPKKAAAAAPVPIGYATRTDITISSRAGLLTVRAHVPITDAIVIEALRTANVKLDPIYND